MALFRKRGVALRPPLADLTAPLDVAGRTIALGDVAVGARVDAGRLSVEVHHRDLASLPDDERLLAAQEILAAALGDKGVRQVVHRLSATAYPPIDSFGLESLRSFARSLGADVDPPADTSR